MGTRLKTDPGLSALINGGGRQSVSPELSGKLRDLIEIVGYVTLRAVLRNVSPTQ